MKKESVIVILLELLEGTLNLNEIVSHHYKDKSSHLFSQYFYLLSCEVIYQKMLDVFQKDTDK